MKIIKYFFEFISIISLFCIFKIIGLRNASSVGSILGKSVGPLFRSKKIIKQNIKTGLGEIDEKKESEIINGMWSNIGRTFAEYVFLKDFKFNRTNFNHIKINGVNHLNEIKKNNEPVLICILDGKYLKKYYETLNYLRENGISSELYLDSSKNLKKQLTYADKKGCPVAIIVGESEIKENKFTLKNLKSSKENDQKTVSKESLIDEIKKIIWKNS